MVDKNTAYKKIAGCLMAGAMGDALGYEVEFISWYEIQKRFGKDGIRDLVVHDHKAKVSDDTQMTLFTNEALLTGFKHEKLQEEGKKPIEYYIYQEYLCWLKTQTDPFDIIPVSVFQEESELLRVPEMNRVRAPGNTCLNALRSGRMGTMETPINNSKGCGGVMRSAPLGFTDYWGSPLIKGAASAAITHGHEGGWIPAGILSDIVYRIIYDEQEPLEEIIQKSIDTAVNLWDNENAKNCYSLVKLAIKLSHSGMEDRDAIECIGGGWVGDEALAIAIYCCLKYSDNIKKALISAVNHNGDSDSTGAIAGNILGACLGTDALPEDWIDKLELTEQIYKQAEMISDIYL